jgi:hypothetical protein
MQVSRWAFIASGVMFVLAMTACVRQDGGLPAAPVAQSTEHVGVEQAAIEQREICVGSSVASAGKLGDTLYYRATKLPDDKLVVGYYAFFSEERPWGNNWLTWTVLPALAVDAVYSHGMFVGPGMQRAISGKGDVEGFRIEYELRPDGSLEVERAVADDGSHNVVNLSEKDLLSLDPKRPTVYTDVWSHQLGGRGVRSRSDLSYVRCFGPGHIRLLPEAIVDEFALGGRAMPAHIEALGGRVLGAPPSAEARVGRPRTRL